MKLNHFCSDPQWSSILQTASKNVGQDDGLYMHVLSNTATNKNVSIHNVLLMRRNRDHNPTTTIAQQEVKQIKLWIEQKCDKNVTDV